MNDHSNRRRRTLIESDPTDLLTEIQTSDRQYCQNHRSGRLNMKKCWCETVMWLSKSSACMFVLICHVNRRETIIMPDVDVVLKLYSTESVYMNTVTDIFSFQWEGCKCNCWKNPNPLSSTTNPVDSTQPHASSTDACRSCSHPLSKAHQFSDFLSSLKFQSTNWSWLVSNLPTVVFFSTFLILKWFWYIAQIENMYTNCYYVHQLLLWYFSPDGYVELFLVSLQTAK